MRFCTCLALVNILPLYTVYIAMCTHVISEEMAITQSSFPTCFSHHVLPQRTTTRTIILMQKTRFLNESLPERRSGRKQPLRHSCTCRRTSPNGKRADSPAMTHISLVEALGYPLKLKAVPTVKRVAINYWSPSFGVRIFRTGSQYQLPLS